GDARGRVASLLLVVGDARLADHRGPGAGGGKLHRHGAVRRGAAGVDLRSGAHRERQVRAGNSAVNASNGDPGRTSTSLADAAWLKGTAVARLLALLDRDGEEARVIGGAVRDALLGREPGEFDVATTALPPAVIGRVEAAGLKAVPTGIDHGTVTVVIDGRGFEVTTLRED